MRQAFPVEGIDGSKKNRSTLALIRKMVLSDRALYDKGRFYTLPFLMSSVCWERVADILCHHLPFAGCGGIRSVRQAYFNHEAAYTPRIKRLDLIEVAQSFGLLRLPRMPQLKGTPRGYVRVF